MIVNNMSLLRKITLLFVIFSGWCLESTAEVKLARIFTSNMVIQRDLDFCIWGWGDANEEIEILFNNITYKTRVSEDRKWEIVLPAQKAGGPFDIEIKGSNTIKLGNVLFGDVWVCSGQSNMYFRTAASKNAFIDLKNANFQNIRLFQIEKDANHLPLTDLNSGRWMICSSESVAKFSAVAYFFGRDLHEQLGVPIGLIHTSWGGSSIQAWMDGSTLKNYDDYSRKIKTIEDTPQYFDQLMSEYKNNGGNVLVNELYKRDPGFNGNGRELNASFFEGDQWEQIPVPGYWEDYELEEYNGAVWYRKKFDMPEAFLNSDLIIDLGWIDDYDFTFFNGQRIGAVTYKGSERKYAVEKEIVKKGVNEIVVCVFDTGWKGGFWGPKKSHICKKNGNALLKVDLQGLWDYKCGISLEDLNTDKLDVNKQPSKRSVPTFLFNAMINPIIKSGIKGVIWYQGESNAGNPDEYSKLLPSMIKGWRKRWNQGHFPFLVVQLANYGPQSPSPENDNWAELRDAQTQTLKVDNTGLAVTIDIGSEMDIHPTNKQEVGKRLMLNALKVGYNKNVVASGPCFKSYKVDGDRIIIEFDNVGGGLVSSDKFGYLKEFAIAGRDNKFVWAKAYIQQNKVIVYSPQVKKPVAVRYAWSANPADVNLYNKEGLPAVPFRTDNR